jgi:hypothetical protein
MQEPSTLPPRGPSHGVATGQTPMALPGSKSPAKVQSGFPRNLELGRSCRLRRTIRHGLAEPQQSRPADRAFIEPAGANRQNVPTAPPSEGNEARRDGRREVAAP